MQTTDQIITAVARTCATLGVTDKQIIVESLNQAQDIVKEHYSWPFFQKQDTITLDAGTSAYDLPSDYDAITGVFYKDTDGTYETLQPISNPAFFDSHDEDETDSPEYYRLAGMDTTTKRPKIELSPPPSAAHIAEHGASLYVEYYRFPATIASGSSYLDWPQEFHAVIQWGAVLLIATTQGDSALAQTSAAIYGQMLKAQSKKYRLRYRAPFLALVRETDGPDPGYRDPTVGTNDNDYGR